MGNIGGINLLSDGSVQRECEDARELPYTGWARQTDLGQVRTRQVRSRRPEGGAWKRGVVAPSESTRPASDMR